MHRQLLLNLLRQHPPADAGEQDMTAATIAFVASQPDCFERSLLTGHITGSAFIIDRNQRQRTLLIHHRKLNRWLQPGGHADGHPDVAAVALREAQEETGLRLLQLVGPPNGTPPIFDVDIHRIPARTNEPAHLHYDIRFLVEADPNEPFGLSEERVNIRWFLLEEAIFYAESESIERMVRKVLKN